MASSNDMNDNSNAQNLKVLNKRELILKIVIAVFLILVSFFIIGFFAVLNFAYLPPEAPEINKNNHSNLVIVSLSGKLKIIPRIEWLAQPPDHPADPLHLPVPYVIILHTATENCTDQAKCTAIVRYTQTYHMKSKGWWDIGYNFLVGGDGYVYVGRGWKGKGAHVYGWNSKSIGIAFIGTFHNILPPEKQISAAKMLIEKGVKDGYIAEDYKLFAQRQLSNTLSPGLVLFENMKSWPHWSEEP